MRGTKAERFLKLSISLPELNASLPMGRSAGRSTDRVKLSRTLSMDRVLN
ncbi:hypothetical protein [Leptospira noguchii]|nr:hypothetical protein [Leptospira noguchii]